MSDTVDLWLIWGWGTIPVMGIVALYVAVLIEKWSVLPFGGILLGAMLGAVSVYSLLTLLTWRLHRRTLA